MCFVVMDTKKKVDFLENIPKNRYLGVFHRDYKNIGFIGYNPSYNWPKISEKQKYNIFRLYG